MWWLPEYFFNVPSAILTVQCTKKYSAYVSSNCEYVLFSYKYFLTNSFHLIINFQTRHFRYVVVQNKFSIYTDCIVLVIFLIFLVKIVIFLISSN